MTMWKRRLWPLLWAAAALCVAKDCSNRISTVGVEGEDGVLSPPVAGESHLTRILWKKGGNIVASSWVSFDPGNETQRLSLDSSSGNLLIKNLSKEDTGHYTAEIFINEKIEEICFDLKILVQPDINCTVNNDTIQLSCTSASQDLPLRYSWDYIRNEEVIYVKDSVVLLQRNSNHFQKITCYVTAFNSSASNSVNWSDCIKPVEEPDHRSRNRKRLISIIIVPVLLILACCIKMYWEKKKENKIPNESEPGAKNARGNCKEESSELSEEERKSLTALELETAGEEEKSEESSELPEKERKSLTALELETAGEEEKSEESSELPEEERKSLIALELETAGEEEKSEESSELSEEERKSLTALELETAGEEEKSEESSELPEEERKSLIALELETAGEEEKSEETSRLES